MRKREEITKKVVGFDDSELILEVLLDIRELLDIGYGRIKK